MYFNNPSVIYASILVIIPVILHFLNLNKVRKIEFSSLMFLKEVKEKKIRKLKIQYLYLMILRILLIAFAVLAFSNPVFYSNLFGNNYSVNSVILIDNSPSSGFVNSELLNKVKNTIKEINSIYPSTSNISIFSIDDLIFGNNKGINFYSSDISFNPNRNLFLLSKYLKPLEKNKTHDLYILSGFYKSDYSDLPVLNDYFRNYNLNLININEKVQSNLSVKYVSVVNSIPDINSNQKIEVEVYNYNNFDVFNKRVRLYLNNETYFEKIIDIQAGKGIKIFFDVPSENKSFLNGYVEIIQDKISDDEVTFDNKKYFSINYPEIIKILLLGDAKNNFEYIEKALRMADGKNSGKSLFNITYSSLLKNDMRDVSLIIISGKKSLSKDEIVELKNYLSKGKGIIIYAGKNMDTETYNSFLSEYTESLKIQTIENINKAEDKLKITNTDDVLISGIFEENINGKSEYSEPININSILKVSDNTAVTKIIENSEKKGILYKIPANRKGILLFSIASDYSMSDFPSKAIFLPLLYRSIFYFADINFNYNFTIGNSGIVNKGSESFIIPVDTNYKKAGNYIFNGMSISLNIDEEECDLNIPEEDFLIDYYKKTGFDNVKYYSNAEQFKKEKLNPDNAANLFYYLLALVFFILLIEMFYSRKITEKLKLINKS